MKEKYVFMKNYISGNEDCFVLYIIELITLYTVGYPMKTQSFVPVQI